MRTSATTTGGGCRRLTGAQVYFCITFPAGVIVIARLPAKLKIMRTRTTALTAIGPRGTGGLFGFAAIGAYVPVFITCTYVTTGIQTDKSEK